MSESAERCLVPRSDVSIADDRSPWDWRHLLLHVLLPLFLGAAIYTCWRSTSLLVFLWYRWLHLYGYVGQLRHAAWPMRHLLPEWVIFSLPDGCWVYSFTAFLVRLWRNAGYPGWAAFWGLLPVALALAAEIGQGLRIVPGTFDVADIAVYIAACLLATYFTRRT